MTLHTMPAADNSYVLACDPDTDGYSHIYHLIGWQTEDGDTYFPVGVCVTSISEQDASRAADPASYDWSLGLFNRGAEVLRPDDSRTFYFVHGADRLHALEQLDAYRCAHFEYDETGE